MASTEYSRRAFAINAASFLLKWGFDGIDIDWEYPSQRGGSVESDKENFIRLLDELKKMLQPLQKILAIAVGASEKTASLSYDIPRMIEHVDFVNLMSYDLHGSWNSFTGLKLKTHNFNVKLVEFYSQEFTPRCFQVHKTKQKN